MNDTNLVLGKYGWYLAEVVLLAFETRLAEYQASRTVTDEIVMIPVVSRDVLPAN